MTPVETWLFLNARRHSPPLRESIGNLAPEEGGGVRRSRSSNGWLHHGRVIRVPAQVSFGRSPSRMIPVSDTSSAMVQRSPGYRRPPLACRNPSRAHVAKSDNEIACRAVVGDAFSFGSSRTRNYQSSRTTRHSGVARRSDWFLSSRSWWYSGVWSGSASLSASFSPGLVNLFLRCEFASAGNERDRVIIGVLVKRARKHRARRSDA